MSKSKINIIKLMLVSLLGIWSTGCDCRDSIVRPTHATHAYDKHLNCKTISFKIMETESYLESLDEKMENVDAYARVPGCLFATKQSMDRAKIEAQERIRYLKLYQQRKNCLAQPNENPTKSSDNTELPITPKT
jgi:hypothetical protein